MDLNTAGVLVVGILALAQVINNAIKAWSFRGRPLEAEDEIKPV